MDLVSPPTVPIDMLWAHKLRSWGFDMGMLAVLSLAYASFVRWKIRLKTD
jgi:hypothetical protein